MKFSWHSRRLRKMVTILMTATMASGLLTNIPEGAFSVKVNAETAESTIQTTTQATLDTSKIDVWDFGGTALEGNYYNNIDTNFINSCYPGVPAGTTGKAISNFTAKDGAGNEAFRFVTNKTNNRWRLTCPKDSSGNVIPVTCYDTNKNKTDASGNIYNGYLYSNNTGATPTSVSPTSTSDCHVEFYLYAGDVLDCWLGSNANAAIYALVDANGSQISTFAYDTKAGVEDATFYAAKEGWYTLYCTNEKLVLARATRQHTPVVTVSGSVSAPDTLASGYSVEFTNTKNGAVTDAVVTDGKYSASLNGTYTYDVTLKDASGYVISSAKEVTVGKDSANFNVSVIAVDLVDVSGTITGLSATQLEALTLTFSSNKVYVPEITFNKMTGAFSFKAEKGVNYSLTAENVNDYNLETTTLENDVATTEASIAFSKKPTYKAGVSFTGLGSLDTSTAKVTFTNINEGGYTYTYGINDDMQLRNGQYSVKVTGMEQYAYQSGITPDVKINNASGSTVVPFSQTSDWTFANLTNSNEIKTVAGVKYFEGLKLGGTGSTAINAAKYLLTASGATVTVPDIKAGDKITVSYCYSASFTMGDVTVDEKSGSTSTISSKEYTATADGDFVITANTGTTNTTGQTYFTEIRVAAAADKVAYKDTVYVGKDKAYKTINDALADVRKMDRTDAQNVTVMIDPGNYEEMLVIDTPNVTLKNASSTPSIELKNKGVDIDENAVRVTWYYGHGYTYYSMGSDSKYNAALLTANKQNGYASYINTGSGTTNGSYWNATVAVEADNVSADGIIFENSFNQYVSAASVNDVIESQSGAKNGAMLRDNMKTAGDTSVQDKAYVKRAAALAIYNSVQKVYFNNCKMIGRQDTLYGGAATTAAFNNCSIYGGTDYIFGAMTAVFNKCKLVFNTSDNTNDVGYITAPQQLSGRGYLMNECTVTSTVPGVDTASLYTSKPGFFGRPWQSNTGEAVFYKTTVETADAYWNTAPNNLGTSLIQSPGWLNTLSGESPLCVEYETKELSGADNSANRVAWAKVLQLPKLADNSDISVQTFLGTWKPFQEPLNLAELNAQKATATTEIKKTDIYTAESIKKLSDVLAAINVMDLSNKTQVQIDELTAQLKAAISELVVKPTEPPTEKPTNPTQTPTVTPTQAPTQNPTEPPTQTPTETTSAGQTEPVITLPQLGDTSVIKSADIQENAVVKDAQGKLVPVQQISLRVTASTEAVNDIESALATNHIEVQTGMSMQCYDIKLVDADGNVLKLVEGCVYVNFTYQDGMDASTYNIAVYHLKDNGVLEPLTLTATENGVSAKVTGFSKFAVVYTEKAQESTATAATNEGTSAMTATTEQPATGDSMNAVAYVLVLAAALALIIYGTGKRKKTE